MAVITSIEQIKNNIEELERGRAAKGVDLEEYKVLIKRGTCFLVYESSGNLSFAPSRFIGYAENKLMNHANNINRDGRVTNAAINHVIGRKPAANAMLDQAYVKFCISIGVVPSTAGAFGVERKYWVSKGDLHFFEKCIENEIWQDPGLSKTEKDRLVKARIGQGKFRENLISIQRRCCVTGCGYVDILRASHIKPWRDSTNAERLDKFNGLLLSPNFDALFDAGLISFKENGGIVISKRLDPEVCESLGCSSDAKICIRPENQKYMQWHRDNVFLDSLG